MVNPELLDLDLPRTGYRKFITSWLYRGSGTCFLVDPGPASTHSQLMESLGKHGVENLDLILLTHIHLDHGGGTGALLREFPAARVYCLPRAVKHLIDPRTLWKSSIKVLAEKAEIFGEPLPVDEAAILSTEELVEAGIEVIPTPGHAAHHVCFLYADILFAGEAVGTRFPLRSGRIFMRPATPPPFRPEIAIASLARLAALDPMPKRMAFAHYGLVEDVSRHLKIAVDQIGLWLEVMAGTMRSRGFEMSPKTLEEILDRLVQVDPFFAPFPELPPDIQVRELEFLCNTFDGLVDYLKQSKSSPLFDVIG